jgi:hypothetical protein
MTNKFRFWAPKAFDWTLDPIKYIFLSLAQNFTSNQAQNWSIFHMKVKKEPKIHRATTRRNWFLRSIMKTNPN